MQFFMVLALGLFMIGLLLAVLDKEHRRHWLAASVGAVLFALSVSADGWSSFIFLATQFLAVALVLAVALAILDKKNRLPWLAAAGGFVLLGTGAYFFRILCLVPPLAGST